MPNPTVSSFRPEVRRLDGPSWRDVLLTPIGTVFAAIRMWLVRQRGRQELQDLAERGEDHLLEDIGLTREDALRMAEKWFWQG